MKRIEVTLEQEQVDLLTAIVEYHLNVPRDKRDKFFVTRTMSTPTHAWYPMMQDDWQLNLADADLEVLASYGFIGVDYGQHGIGKFSVRPEGIDAYRQLKRAAGEPVAQTEAEVRRYLDSEEFAGRYPEANAKWRSAADGVWGSDSDRAQTAIGHHCREAMQAFAAELVARYEPPSPDTNPEHTVARVRAVLTLVRDKVGEAEAASLDALLAYWGTVADLTQRQEHGAQRDGEALAWEDGRRIVFQTAIVMFEVARAARRVLG